MLTWETANPPELKGPNKYSEKQGAVKLLLDGQQRVTTLYMLINGDIPPYYTAPEIMNDTRWLYVNVETLELLYYMKTRMENNPSWQNITDVFRGKVSAFDLQAKYAEIGKDLEMDDLKRLNDTSMPSLESRNVSFLSRRFPLRRVSARRLISSTRSTRAVLR
jgi:hypothetical protein